MALGYYLTATALIQNSQAVSPAGGTNAAEYCELHVFPTREIIDSSPDYHDIPGAQPSLLGSLVGGALSAAQSAGSGKLRTTAVQQMQSYLTPDVQVEEIVNSGVTNALRLPRYTKIVEEEALPPPFGDPPKDPKELAAYKRYWAAAKKGIAISSAASPCYRELIIASISVSKGLGSLKFSTSFVYRIFDENHSETKIFDGERSVPKPDHFPALTEGEASLARTAIRSAFVATFSDWLAHRVKL